MYKRWLMSSSCSWLDRYQTAADVQLSASALRLTGWRKIFRLSCLKHSTAGVLDKTGAEVIRDRNTILLSKEASKKTPEELRWKFLMHHYCDFKTSLPTWWKTSTWEFCSCSKIHIFTQRCSVTHQIIAQLWWWITQNRRTLNHCEVQEIHFSSPSQHKRLLWGNIIAQQKTKYSAKVSQEGVVPAHVQYLHILFHCRFTQIIIETRHHGSGSFIESASLRN